jgi:hypothetical protein
VVTPTGPAADDPRQGETYRVPRVGEIFRDTQDVTRTVTVTRVWMPEPGQTAVAFDIHDGRPGQAGSALRLYLFLNRYAPVDPVDGTAMSAQRLDRIETALSSEHTGAVELQGFVAELVAEIRRTRGRRTAATHCGACSVPFDPADVRWDGHGRHGGTDWCNRCVDRCHDNDSAGHRCRICS